MFDNLKLRGYFLALIAGFFIFSRGIFYAEATSKPAYSFATLKANTLQKEKYCEMASKKYYDSGITSDMNEGAER